jgi:hypothetical protein
LCVSEEFSVPCCTSAVNVRIAVMAAMTAVRKVV